MRALLDATFTETHPPACSLTENPVRKPDHLPR